MNVFVDFETSGNKEVMNMSSWTSMKNKMTSLASVLLLKLENDRWPVREGRCGTKEKSLQESQRLPMQKVQRGLKFHTSRISNSSLSPSWTDLHNPNPTSATEHYWPPLAVLWTFHWCIALIFSAKSLLFLLPCRIYACHLCLCLLPESTRYSCKQDFHCTDVSP